MNTTYRDFLEQKINFRSDIGHETDDTDVNPILFPHQRDIVRWAVAGGRRAIFAAFGLGKSVMQLETVRLTLDRCGGRALIICPLGVRQEFVHDATMLGMATTFVRRSSEVDAPGVYLTNYESIRDGKLDPSLFNVLSLDEASVLRSYGSKTFQTFLDVCSSVPFKFVATATPSPNRYKELIHYAGFLGVMDTGQALTRFFQRDSTQANNLTLYPHKEEEFWLWLASWAIFLQKPSDLGHPDDGYTLPAHRIIEHEIEVNHLEHIGVESDGQSIMFRGAQSLGVSDASKEKRQTMPARIAQMMDIVRAANCSTDNQVVIWCDLNDEQRAIEHALAADGITYSSIYGSLDIDETERRLAEWKDRQTVALVGKPVMLGQGLNLQQCHRAVFVGITFKFNDLIQATHRIYRFGQDHECETHLIYAESEREVHRILMTKWKQHEELTSIMSNIIRSHGLNQIAINDTLSRSIGVERIDAAGELWQHVNNDCVEEVNIMDDDSVDMIVTSIPFSNHYEYTPSYNDFGHTDNNGHFWSQMDYLTPELLRILSPGRIYACHVKDRILFGNVTGAGAPTVSPFHAEALMHGIKHGFDYMGMITVTTDVVRENGQTYRLSWSEQAKDGTKMGIGSPEYILLFRKPQTDRTKGYADVRVAKSKDDYSVCRWQVDAHAYWKSSGNRHLSADDVNQMSVAERMRLFADATANGLYDYEAHVALAEELDARGGMSREFMMLAPGSSDPAVWTDVNRLATLNTAQSQKHQAKHVCPLQFDIVDRLINRYTNPGELVFDPFGGLATVPVRAMKLGRRGRSVELNPGYWLDGVRYCQATEREVSMPSLFDLIDDNPAA